MESNNFNNVPGISICQSTSVDTLVSGCDGRPLKTDVVIVLNHDQQYTGSGEEGTAIAILEKNKHFGHLKFTAKSCLFAKYTDKYGQTYILCDVCILLCLMTILLMVILFSLGRDAEKLMYVFSYLARFMGAAILTIENEAQTVS